MRDIMKNRLHQGAGHRRAAIQRGNWLALVILNGTEARISIDTWIELVSLMLILVHPMHQLAAGDRSKRDLKLA